MAKKNRTPQDRRAVVEQMRRDQQRAERRRTLVVVAACVLVGAVIIGVGAVAVLRQQQAASASLEDLGAAAQQAGCRPIETKPANGNNQHLQIGTPIKYPDAPPAFGPHWPVPAPFARKFYTADDRPQLEYLVHNLEHGYTLLWYDDTVAGDGAELNAVKAIAAKFEGSKTNFRDKFIAVPWTSSDGAAFPDGTHVALTHWSRGTTGKPADQVGVWEYCQRPSGAVVQQFMKKYPFTDSPEPQAM